MRQEGARRSRKVELPRLRENRKKLNEALKTLFDLLEEYAPLWYTKEHHDQAKAAIACNKNKYVRSRANEAASTASGASVVAARRRPQRTTPAKKKCSDLLVRPDTS